MNAKKERELFIRSIEQHLERENRILGEYRALLEIVKGGPAALLVDWVIAESGAHKSILCAILKDLKQPRQEEKEKGSKNNGSGVEAGRILFWTKKLRLYEERSAADCLYLKSQGYWGGGELLDALVDAMIMDSKKHQRILLAVEKMVKV